MQGHTCGSVMSLCNRTCGDLASTQQISSTSLSRYESCRSFPPAPHEQPCRMLREAQQQCDKVVPAEVSRWEQKLKNSRDRLHVMRMERAQWHAMVCASDAHEQRERTSNLHQGMVTQVRHEMPVHHLSTGDHSAVPTCRGCTCNRQFLDSPRREQSCRKRCKRTCDERCRGGGQHCSKAGTLGHALARRTWVS